MNVHAENISAFEGVKHSAAQVSSNDFAKIHSF